MVVDRSAKDLEEARERPPISNKYKFLRGLPGPGRGSPSLEFPRVGRLQDSSPQGPYGLAKALADARPHLRPTQRHKCARRPHSVDLFSKFQHHWVGQRVLADTQLPPVRSMLGAFASTTSLMLWQHYCWE